MLTLVACSHDAPDSAVDAGTELDLDVADADGALDAGPDAAEQSCIPLFGVPGDRTGLGDDECAASCGCDAISAVDHDEVQLEAWLQWELAEPRTELVEDPYDSPEPSTPTDEVCVAIFDATSGSYRLETRAEPGDGVVTHAGPCGLCSTLEDLVAYIRNPDLTEPVRECGLLGVREGEEANLTCLQDLGFTRPCAQIWYYNTVNTRTECLVPCFELIDAPYHTPGGGLNDCLTCDEENSGPVFKQVAGRTRRNSGLASAICRPCETVASVAHDYPSR